MNRQWKKYMVQFDCDKYGRTMLKYSPWSGHRNFAYDLIAWRKPEVTVELGSFYGCSTFAFLQAAKDLSLTGKFYAVDVWEKYDVFTLEDYDQDVYGFFKNIAEREYSGTNLQMLRMKFDDAAKQFPDKSIDLLHVDGAHDYETVKHDYRTWLPKMKDQGIILFHDISHLEVNGRLLGSADLWDEIKAGGACTYEFPYSYGLGILFLNEQDYRDFINAFDYNVYLRDYYCEMDCAKDELRKDYFLQKQQQERIEHLESDKQICDDCIQKLAEEVNTVKSAYEKTIGGKDEYIDQLEKRLFDQEKQKAEEKGFWKEFLKKSSESLKTGRNYGLVKKESEKENPEKQLRILSYQEGPETDAAKPDLHSVIIWGTSPRGTQIRQFVEQICGGKVEAFLSRENLSDRPVYESVPVYEADSFLGKGREATLILGTILPEEQKEMLKTIRESSFKGTVVTSEYFHRMCEVPGICGQASPRYDIDFNEKMKRWVENYLSEVDFWKNDVARPDGAYWNHYTERIAPKDFCCGRAMKYIKRDSVILDVGCGVCSQYGTRWENTELNLTGVDPLAPFYNRINRQYVQNNKPGFTVSEVAFGMFELLSYRFGNDYCDVILIDNALDHCIDPLVSVLECLKVLKVGGVLSTFHHMDEAYKAFYSDLHQWNICLDGKNDLIIWNHQNWINVRECLEEYVDFETEFVADYTNETPYGGVMCNMIKKKEIPDDFMSLENKTRAGFILENMMEQLSSCEYSERLLQLMGESLLSGTES